MTKTRCSGTNDNIIACCCIFSLFTWTIDLWLLKARQICSDLRVFPPNSGWVSPLLSKQAGRPKTAFYLFRPPPLLFFSCCRLWDVEYWVLEWSEKWHHTFDRTYTIHCNIGVNHIVLLSFASPLSIVYSLLLHTVSIIYHVYVM